MSFRAGVGKSGEGLLDLKVFDRILLSKISSELNEGLHCGVNTKVFPEDIMTFHFHSGH